MYAAANGASTAFGEITLVLLTTLAPSGVLAFALASLPSIAGRVSERERVALDRFLCVPITTALVGLVASATHLGNPSNALYVLAGVGRSPLSNEVACGVVFLGLAGVYWLTSFSERPRAALRRVALAAVDVAGALFVCAIAFAYDAETILTWRSGYVPAALCLNALLGGPLLALLTLRLAGCACARGRFAQGLVVLSALALAAGVAVYAVQGAALGGMENHLTTASARVPGYAAFVAAYALLAGAGVVGAARTRAVLCNRRAAKRLAVSCALVAASIFAMRFAFYMSHMTVGL